MCVIQETTLSLYQPNTNIIQIGLDFAQRYKLGVDWDTSRALYLWLDGSKIATAMKKVIQKDK